MSVGRWLGLAGWLALGYGGVCLLVFLTQRSLIYLPQPAADPSGQLVLQVEGKRVLVAHRPHAGSRALIYFGGNAEDVSLTRAELAVLLPDTALYLLHYRGYGGSEGSPSEAALRADAQALHAHVAKRHDAITVVGRSLGTGPAVHLAATRPVQRLVLLVPFDSLLAVARGTMPWLPVDLLLRDRWEAAAEAPRVRAPTTIVAAAIDRVVPTRHAIALHRAFPPGVAELVLVPDLDHNTPVLSSAAFRAALQGQIEPRSAEPGRGAARTRQIPPTKKDVSLQQFGIAHPFSGAHTC
ncbi:alpha/beta hydrolase [Synechococcus sp. CS-1324]|uniref:alpha/beta hydrolase n=1 Tax=Synechococcus sp. CS-1324 TaxID=2847980 RepID=UPI00223B3E48|nr:alpha/beta hydrolase [Synechococcus sp. CS-1324]MCT0230898.1 alpha/beta hydrolase [Synechococcus sp. CS-1324]